MRGAHAERGHATDHVACEVEPVQIVADPHVERRGRRPLLLVAPDMQVVMVGPAIREPMDEPRITVESEDDGLVGREERVEIPVG